MSGRVSNADIIRAQEARIDSLTLLVEKLVALEMARIERSRTASETFELKRAATGDNVTTIAALAVAQEGESLAHARARAEDEFEKSATRHPLPNGYAHPAALGAKAEAPPSLAEQLATSVADELASKRAGRGGKDGAK